MGGAARPDHAVASNPSSSRQLAVNHVGPSMILLLIPLNWIALEIGNQQFIEATCLEIGYGLFQSSLWF